MELDEWFKLVDQDYGMCLNDIVTMQAGESVKVLFIDRNFLDVLEPDENGIVDVNSMVASNKLYTGEYTKSGNDSLKGRFEWYFDHHIEEEFEFHVLRKTWMPLLDDHTTRMGWERDRALRSEQQSCDRALGGELPKIIKEFHYTNLVPTTPIGWRGCAIRLQDVPELPLLRLNA